MYFNVISCAWRERRNVFYDFQYVYRLVESHKKYNWEFSQKVKVFSCRWSCQWFFHLQTTEFQSLEVCGFLGNFYRLPWTLLSNTSIYYTFPFVTIDKFSRLLCKDNSDNELVPVSSYLFKDICLQCSVLCTISSIYHLWVTAISIQTYYLSHIKIIIKISFNSISQSDTSPPFYALSQ